MKKTTYDILSDENAFDLIGKQWMLVTAGNSNSFNTMTASWGGFGWLWNKPVAFIFIRPERYTHHFIEANDRLTLSFYSDEYKDSLQLCGTKSGRNIDKAVVAGLTPVTLESGTVTFAEARLTLDCKKLFKVSMQDAHFIDKELIPKWYCSHGGFHDIYIVEIDCSYID